MELEQFLLIVGCSVIPVYEAVKMNVFEFL